MLSRCKSLLADVRMLHGFLYRSLKDAFKSYVLFKRKDRLAVHDITSLFCLIQTSAKTHIVGANVTLSDLLELFANEATKSSNTGGYNEIKKYLYRIASSPMRNVSCYNEI